MMIKLEPKMERDPADHPEEGTSDLNSEIQDWGEGGLRIRAAGMPRQGLHVRAPQRRPAQPRAASPGSPWTRQGPATHSTSAVLDASKKVRNMSNIYISHFVAKELKKCNPTLN